MAKWYGKIGYSDTVETEPGIWEESIVEYSYFGDMTSDRRKRETTSGVNDNINLANVISIVADPFAIQNCSKMVYAEVMGEKWKITSVEVQRPRLILTIGGVWNEAASRTSENS